MSILIKGMKMPKGCYYCPLVQHLSSACYANVRIDRDDWYRKRADGCPLVELPEKHGRLIDADVLHVLFENQWHYLQCLNWDENPTAEMKQTGINWCINTLHDDAPTIIEAEEEEE